MKNNFILYLIRWQLSTPVLALCLHFLNLGTLLNTIVANLVGGIIFYWVDRYIFNGGKHEKEMSVHREKNDTEGDNKV